MYLIKFTPILSVYFAKAIIEKCENAILSNEKKVLFDLSSSIWADPFAITLLVGAIKACVATNKEVSYRRPKEKKLEHQLTNMGFYEWGAGSGKGRNPNSQVQLRHLQGVDPLYRDQIIKVLQNKISMSDRVRDSLRFSIIELMTNTFDHSKTIKGCFICAQAYKSRRSVHLCITDFGIGILAAPSSVKSYAHLTNSSEAILLAVKKGTTSRTTRLGGLGLTYIHEFLKLNHGKIDIISGDGWVHWNYENNDIKMKKLRVAFEGTIVNISAKADAAGWSIMPSENSEDEIF